MLFSHISFCLFFFFNDTATTEIYTLSLHDALPISGHSNAVRSTEGARRFEAEDEKQAANHEGRVHSRDVDLPHLRPRRMNDRHAGTVVELHALLRPRKNRRPYQGFSASRIAGARTISRIPRVAIVPNHTSMIGPKTLPTLAVPYFWTKNSRKRMSRVDGST